jgi:3-dehydroquinate dehydratase/shikimate dehydrogenase
MICISIAQESRRLALVDMFNAAKQCELLEIQLDRFGKAPDLGELLANKPGPVIMSCRRPQDGGQWGGNEDERLALLRQCIISKADFVEIELDVADQIRPFPPARRVIAYTNLKETPADIADIYAAAETKHPDVIKLVTVARTPEEAWPLLQVLSKATVPTVVVGLGKPGIMLSILGRKLGAPWAYAALERGMEAYPDQPTVYDLKQVYHYPDIGKTTPLLGVTGLSRREYVIAGALNAGLAQLGKSARCWPLQVGDMRLFRKVMEVVKLKGVVVSDPWRKDVLGIVTDLEPAAKQAQAADLILYEDKTWHGYNLLWRAAGAALEAVLGDKYPSDKPLEHRVVMIVGANPTARSVALGVKSRGGIPIVASRDRATAQGVAQEIGCRYLPFEAMYSTKHDVLIVCAAEEEDPMQGRVVPTNIHVGYLKPSITVMDVTRMPEKSDLLVEAEKRGCDVVTPRRLLLEQVVLALQLMTEQAVPREQIEPVLNELAPEEA